MFELGDMVIADVHPSRVLTVTRVDADGRVHVRQCAGPFRPREIHKTGMRMVRG